MPVGVLSDAELARLSGWPGEIADDDLVAFFTLTSDDLAWLSGNVRVENRLGAAVPLCALPWLGWIPTGRGKARWAMRWKPALNAFAITFNGRITPTRQLTNAGSTVNRTAPIHAVTLLIEDISGVSFMSHPTGRNDRLAQGNGVQG